jgi:hypothetical protein
MYENIFCMTGDFPTRLQLLIRPTAERMVFWLDIFFAGGAGR